MNKMQNETLQMKRTKEPRLTINDSWRNLINSMFLLFFFFFFLDLMQMLENLEQTSHPKVPSHNLCECSFLPH